MRETYCIGDELMKAIENAGPDGFTQQTLRYLLTTGNNWAGNIDRFTLMVEKEEEKQIVSFCGSPVEQISPTVYRPRQTD